MNFEIKDKKHLVVSGCSFTRGHEMGDKGSWAYYLSSMLGLEYHNLSKGGMGNEFISDSIMAYLLTNEKVRENCVVGVAWSDVSRLMSPVQLKTNNPENILCTVQPQDFLIFDNTSAGKYIKYKDARIFFSDILFTVYKTYMAIISLNSFLERYNIPYFYIDAINPNKVDIINNNETVIMYEWVSGTIELDFLGWPYEYRSVINNKINNSIFNNFLKVGEFKTILSLLHSDYDNLTKGNPYHPNDIASKKVAELIYQQII